ncbi:MAG: alpha/beta fold hydrolase [Puniceicoccaceae bacterium]|nr:MAG: alpha/beta fold hydrolase [Puniceicoccaceae bacterium]
MPETMPLLAMHGFTGRGSDFAPFAALCADLAVGTWHCPDLPGHGIGNERDCSPEATVRWIEATAASAFAATDTSPRIALGYSMGARAALLHAIEHPEAWDALILVSGNPGIQTAEDRAARVVTDEELAQSLQRMGVPAFLEFWQETPLIRSQKNILSAWRERMLEARQQHTVDGLVRSLRQFGQGSYPNLWPSLKELKIPICLITGARDEKYTEIAQRMRPLLPNLQSRAASIEAASHMPHLEQAKATAAVVTEFLKQIIQPSPARPYGSA